MYKHRELTEDRIRLAIDRLKLQLWESERPLEIEASHLFSEPLSYEQAVARLFKPFALGELWGPDWTTSWFRFSGQIPVEWKGRDVRARIRFEYIDKGEGFSVEGLVWRDGKPERAININRDDVPISTVAQGGETFSFFLEAAANPSGEVMKPAPTRLLDTKGLPQFRLEKAMVGIYDGEAQALVYDLQILHELMLELPVGSARRGQLLYGLNEALNTLKEEDRATYAQARRVLAPLLAKKNGDTVHRISAIGHAHIDTAWLWPLRETMRKCARTFSTQLRYMEEFPEYIFGCSQAQQYAWMKKHYPAIFAGIQAAVKRGQWEPIGSMWVEPDCNLSSGESLVRQILHGKRFFQEELGVETKDVWIPDVFGYSASMPQIMKKAGVSYFLTQKISWNQFNKFPHHTFLWEGIDGTQIFTHFPPADTYNAPMSPKNLTYNVTNFKEHDRATRSLCVYGYGDGGGGPTRQMLEFARRAEDLEGLPPVTLEKVRDFFPKAEADARDLPVWVGELYLELHRGTYTTQAHNKRSNRKGEFLLREAELWDALTGGLQIEPAPLAAITAPAAVYDVYAGGMTIASYLDRAWKLLLLNQFHDIIPGSSIHWVYLDSAKDYTTIRQLGDSVVCATRGAMMARINTEEFRKPVVVFNSLSHERQEIVTLPDGAPAAVTVPAMGYRVVETDAPDAAAFPPVRLEQAGGGVVVDNAVVRVEIDGRGLLTRVYDYRAKREVLAANEPANLFQLHPDTPNCYEAWDVDLFYKERVVDLMALDSLRVIENHPLRVVVELIRSFGHSKITQRIIVRAGSARLDFETDVDWHERSQFLKVAFPVNVRSPRATYEIQYGHLERPTHANTSWDMARFEVCAQKWADLSEADYGVALLNDCKYGYDIWGHVMRLSLLRSPIAPDQEADRGRHTFTYALLPHSGDCRQSGVIDEAYDLNVPLQLMDLPVQPGELPAERSFFTVDRSGVVIEAVKKAEDGNGMVVRLYEAHGSRGPLTVSTILPVKTASLVNLLEAHESVLTMVNGEVQLEVKPFEIITLKYQL